MRAASAASISGCVTGLELFAAPVGVGAAVAIASRVRLAKSYWLFLLGVLLGFAFVVVVYLTSAHDYASSDGIDGELFLGRWWDPTFTVLLAILGYIGWCTGVVVGLLVRGSFDAVSARRRSSA